MACLNLSIPAPQIPPIFINLPSFNFTISFGQLGISCCHIVLPTFSIPIPIPSPGSVFATQIAAINAAIQAAFSVLCLTIPNCPGNGYQL